MTSFVQTWTAKLMICQLGTVVRLVRIQESVAWKDKLDFNLLPNVEIFERKYLKHSFVVFDEETACMIPQLLNEMCFENQ